jgi:hypothetical protein
MNGSAYTALVGWTQRSSMTALGRAILDRGSRSEMVQDGNLLRKIRRRVKLPHEESGASTRLRPGTPALPQTSREKAPRKNPPRFIPSNPLKSLDSDERIQGNPSESNALNRGFQSETARGQDNPNGTIGANIAAASKRPRPLRMVQRRADGIAAVRR